MGTRKFISTTIKEYLSEQQNVENNLYIINQIKEVGVEESKVSHYKTKAPIKIKVNDYLYGHDVDYILKNEESYNNKRSIDIPIDIYIEDTKNPYLEIVDGNHRFLQAKYNDDDYILAYVHFIKDVYSEIFK